jgi:Na+/H+-translocating membrane pyrophosphatase
MRRIAAIFCWALFALAVALFAAGYFALTMLKVPEDAGMLYGMFAAHWIGTVMACVLAFLLNFPVTERRVWLSLILSVLALVSSYWGLASIHITRTQTVNGQFQRLFDSRWFFTVSLVLAILALTLAVWKRWRLRYMT